MKKFGLYFRIKITNESEWFADFLEKYYESSQLHISLIQARCIGESQIDELKSRIKGFWNTNKLAEKDRVLEFNNFEVVQEGDGTHTFMLHPDNRAVLFAFQKDLKDLLKEFKDYAEEVTKQYEENFRPHITVGVNVPNESLDEASAQFKSGFKVEGVITDLALAVVNDLTIEERYDLKNITIFE